MTGEQLSKLSLEEKRVKIAEACGWKPFTGDKSRFHEHLRNEPMWMNDGQTTPEGWDQHTLGDLPDYLNDLNAMHEAEKTAVGNKLAGEYDSNLRRIFGARSWTWHATAAQRADAFLLTVE